MNILLRFVLTLLAILPLVAAAAPLSGTKSIGPTGDYASVTAAIADVQAKSLGGALVLELQPTYVSTGETFPLTIPALNGASSVNTVTLRPQSGATGLSITSANTTAATLDLSGAQFVMIDGRPGGTGTAKQLTIANTSTSGVAVRFINNGSNNLLHYLTIRGVNTSAQSGTVVFSTTTGASGNNNNTIDTCDIRDGASTPANGIYSEGTGVPASANNTGDTISNCNIFNFYRNAAVDTAGVKIAVGANWTITGNSFYQTVSRAGVAANVRTIYLADNVNSHTVTGNFIGGSAPNAAGTAWTTTGTAQPYLFVGIWLSVTNNTATNVQGNTIQNFNWSSSSSALLPPGVWSGIYVQTGLVNIGNISGNTIGSSTGTGSVSVTTSGSGGASYGISSRGTSPEAIANNTVGSMTMGGGSMIGIGGTQGKFTITGNLVGSTTTANSLNASASGALGVVGIQIDDQASTSTATITGNTVANLQNSGGTLVSGIRANTGTNTITRNTIFNLATGTQTIGIDLTTGNQGQTISQNTIYSLSNSSSTGTVTGIFFSGSNTNLIARNLVYNLTVAAGSATGQVTGMDFEGGSVTVQNNMVRLGIDANGATSTGGSQIFGILVNNGSSGENFYHNSIYVGGTATIGAAKTYAFRYTQQSNARDYRNNIFVNNRSNGAATGKHYAISDGGVSTNSALTSNGNIFLANGTGGVLGQYNNTDRTSLSAWQTATGQDANSLAVDPLFLNPTGTSTMDLHLQNFTPAESAGTLVSSVIDDYDGQTRSALTPVDIGADAKDFNSNQPQAPLIGVEQPIGTNLTNGISVVNFGSSSVGVGVPLTFNILNRGTAALTISSVSVDGVNSSDFSVTTPPASSVSAGSNSTMVVTFTPTAAGNRSAMLHVLSNDPNTSSFNVYLVSASASTLNAGFNSATTVPVTASSYVATGSTVNLSLNFTPLTGTNLTVVNNTGLGFIVGAFSNLAQGQVVSLSFGGGTYKFVANYYGGTGNDLVLEWANNRLLAWGDGAGGQLGNNTITGSLVPGPVNMSGLLYGKTIVSVAAGVSHTLALCSDGTLAAWGSNSNGELGNNSTTQSTLPVAVSTSGLLSGKAVVAVAAGRNHSLALCSDGTLAAWGDDASGELGNNSTTDSKVPVAVDMSGVLSGKIVVGVAAGAEFSLVLCSDGTMAAWGQNTYGQLGNGGNLDSSVPVAVTTVGTTLETKSLIAVAAGYLHSLALCSDGTVAAWGYNGQGELGNTGGNSNVPVAVFSAGALSGKFVTAVNPGAYHNLVQCSDSTLFGWGYDDVGQLGSIGSNVPIPLVTLGNVLAGKIVVALGAGFKHSLAVCSDGSLAAWGQNNKGQLGNNSIVDSNVAVAVNTDPLALGERFVSATSGQSAQDTFAVVAEPPPAITASNANLAANATTLVIQGTGFDPVAANNTVTLSNGAVGFVTAATATSLTVAFATNPNSLGGMTATVISDGVTSGAVVQVATVVQSYALATSTLVEGPGAGADTVVLTVTPASGAWTAVANDSWLHTTASGTGSANVLFTFDANLGATRTGTLTIGGQTLTVTQAGSSYVAAVPVTPLASGFGSPEWEAVDNSGNVYITDHTANQIKKWTAATNSVSSLVSGLASSPQGVAVDGAGNVYFVDNGSNAVKKWTAATQTVSTLISSGVNGVLQLAVDQAGNLYMANGFASQVQKWTAASGVVSMVADSGPNQGWGVTVDASGNVYFIYDGGTNSQVVKKWTAATNTVSTLIPHTGLSSPAGLAVDASGNLYIADGSSFIKKWTAATNTLTTLASVTLAQPVGVAVDARGNVYFGDNNLNTLKEVPRAFVDTGANTELPGAGTDALSVVLPASENLLPPFAPTSDQSWLTIGTVSNAVVNFNFSVNNTGTNRTAHITLLGQSITVTQLVPVVTSSTANVAGDALSFVINGANFDPIAANNTVTLNNGATGVVTAATATSLTVAITHAPTVAGNLTAVVTTDGSSSGVAVQVATVTQVYKLAVNALVEGPGASSDTIALIVTPEGGTWTAIANDAWLHTSASGTGSASVPFSFDANPGDTRTGTLTIGGQTLLVTQAGSSYVAANSIATLTASVLQPQKLAVDGAGNVFITKASSITKWNIATNSTNVIVSGVTQLDGVAVDSAGNVYFADGGNNTINKWTASTQSVSILVGSGLFFPRGVTVDTEGNVYFVDNGHFAVKKWTASTGSVSTVVSGLTNPNSVTVDAIGNLYISDQGDVVRKWTAATNTVSTLVGSGLSTPVGLAADNSGNVYIADANNHAIKKWAAATGTVTSVVSASDGLSITIGVAVDPNGNVYFADMPHNLVRELPRGFVDATAKTELPGAGSDALAPVLPVSENLLPPFAPSSDQPWLTIGTISNGVVNYSFTANNAGMTRTAHITVLGQSITVAQLAPVVTANTANLPATATGIVITGANFDPVAANNSVTFNDGAVGTVTDATSTSLTVTFSAPPATAGSLTAVVTTDGAFSGEPVQVATVMPVITSSTANFADNSATITINGFGFDPTAANNLVSFNNGAVGQVIVSTTTSLTISLTTMPSTAGTLTAVVTTNGQANGAAVQVGTVLPVVISNAANLPANAITFTVQGYGFDPVAANNSVTLSNGMAGVVTAATTTSLTVSVTTFPTSTGAMTVVVAVDSLSSGSPVQVATLVPSHVLATSSLVEGPAAGSDTVILTVTPESGSWTATANDSWLHTSASGTGSGIVLFTFDANPGATRLGTLTIGGQTLTVTQAGSTYVAATPMVTISSPLQNPQGVAVDDNGDVYISQGMLERVVKWTKQTNTIAPLVDTGLSFPAALAVDRDGNVYIADLINNSVLKWTAATQTLSTIVSGLSGPKALAVDRDGNVYVADSGSNAVKKWTAATQTVSTLVSTGLNRPSGVAVDDSGNVYIADSANDVVKKWTAATQTVSTVVPLGLHGPNCILVDGSGNLYIADVVKAVTKWSAATQTSSLVGNLGALLPSGMAADKQGNLFLTIDDAQGLFQAIPNAFVDPTSKLESPADGTGSLPVVLPRTENLLPPFAPSSDQSWLTIDSVVDGVVHFSFPANAGATRSAHITLLGQPITITQVGPVIGVQQPAGNDLTSGSSVVDFGSMYFGNGATKFFNITNTGSSNLNLGTLTIDGANASEFKITAAPSSTIAPSGNGPFTVVFTPTATGARSATLHIPSDDPATASFTVTLQGTGVAESTLSATNVSSGWALLNGTANPNGLATVADFQYGTSTGYGSSTPQMNMGSGSTATPVNFNLAGLTKGKTYHYRLVITNSQGTFVGADQTFTTPATTSPPAWHSAQVSALTNANLNNMADGARAGAAHNSWQLYFYRGLDCNIWCVYWTGSAWTQVQLSSIANASDWLAFGTSYNLCCYQGLDGKLWSVYWSGSAWVTVQLGNPASGVTVAGDVVIDQAWNIIYYRGSNSKVYAVQWNGSQWTHTALAGSATVKAGLAVDTTNHLLYYQGTDNKLWCYQWTGAVWQQVLLGSNTNVGSSLTVDSKGLAVYYRSSADNSAWLLYWNGAAWVQIQLNASANMLSSATTASSTTAYPVQYDTLYLDNNGQCESLYWSGSQWTHVLMGDGGSGLTGSLSLQPTVHWAFARRSDGNVLVFYYQ